MSPYFEVTMPQLGVNDETVTIVEWLFEPGAEVHRGDPLATVETTKAAFELESEQSGFFYPIAEAGEEVSVRTTVALILEEPHPAVVEAFLSQRSKAPSPAHSLYDGLQLTARARALAEQYAIDASDLPRDRIVRERDILDLLGHKPSAMPAPEAAELNVAVYGASQGGLAVVDCLRTMTGARAIGFVDDDPALVGTNYEGLPVWAGKHLAALAGHGVNAIATHIARGTIRLALRDRAAQAGFAMANVIHARAWVSDTATMGVGNLIKAGAVVDAHVSIGDCSIIDNGVVLPHHNRIGNGCHLAPGAVFGGDCEVGDGAIIGVGAMIAPRTRIGRNALVGVGACVVRDIPDDAVVEGQPARIVGSRRK